ncbi:DUF2637 domain-containing protein [Streptomyces sp. NPDC090798]|uniref:DUF2637 domain-containing protein n=1 Tax=Streptomyces sp. NPDC090798 TaxID=3365968 RepID=UPI003825E3D9
MVSVHQRAFALQGGADATSAALWPLSLDGLLLLATVGLLKPTGHIGRRARATVWRALLLGVGVSPTANTRGTGEDRRAIRGSCGEAGPTGFRRW